MSAYVAATHRGLSPNIQKLMLAPKNIDKYALFLKHERATLSIAAKNLKIKLDVLQGGKGAYAINNKDRTNFLASIGNWVDKHPK